MTIKVTDLDENGIATDCGTQEELVTKLQVFIGNMMSDYVSIEIDEIAISEGDDWRVAS
jgi:hypothetical protein